MLKPIYQVSVPCIDLKSDLYPYNTTDSSSTSVPAGRPVATMAAPTQEQYFADDFDAGTLKVRSYVLFGSGFDAT